VQADTGKAGGAIESLLVEHAEIEQNRRAIGKIGLCRAPIRGNKKGRPQTACDFRKAPKSDLFLGLLNWTGSFLYFDGGFAAFDKFQAARLFDFFVELLSHKYLYIRG